MRETPNITYQGPDDEKGQWMNVGKKYLHKVKHIDKILGGNVPFEKTSFNYGNATITATSIENPGGGKNYFVNVDVRKPKEKVPKKLQEALKMNPEGRPYPIPAVVLSDGTEMKGTLGIAIAFGGPFQGRFYWDKKHNDKIQMVASIESRIGLEMFEESGRVEYIDYITPLECKSFGYKPQMAG